MQRKHTPDAAAAAQADCGAGLDATFVKRDQ